MERFLKFTAFVLFGLFIFSFAPFADAEEELTFGYVAGVQDPFMVLIQKGAEDKAKELGGVKIISQIPGVWSVDTQSPIWKAMASRGVDLVFGCPVDKEALIPVLKDVYERGIPVITTDTYIGDGDYTDGSDNFVLSAIHTDNITAGEKGGHALAKLIGEKGKVYLQEFHVGVSTSDERSAGFIKVKITPGQLCEFQKSILPFKFEICVLSEAGGCYAKRKRI